MSLTNGINYQYNHGGLLDKSLIAPQLQRNRAIKEEGAQLFSGKMYIKIASK
jgi:hypothetical protein